MNTRMHQNTLKYPTKRKINHENTFMRSTIHSNTLKRINTLPNAPTVVGDTTSQTLEQYSRFGESCDL